jgi:integrase
VLDCGSEVDLEDARLTVVRQITRTNEHLESEGDPKTRRSRRSLIVPRVCVEQLVRHQHRQAAERSEALEWVDRELVWPSETGTPLSPSNLRRLLRRQCELAGIRQVTFHTLRHSAATLLLAQGVPSAVILDVLAHQDVRMPRRYQPVTDSLRQDAADVVDRSFPVALPVNDEAPG